jgi:predicted O-methyltransferase YrrM
LLPALADQLGAGLIVEVGTFTGMGTVALLEVASRVVTYDLVAWSEIPNSVLRQTDFTDGSVEQRLGDLSNPAYFKTQIETLSDASFIFVDGPKDKVFEPALTRLLRDAFGGTGKIVVFDDVRVANMLAFWSHLDLPKCDATSLGHWSGTGLVAL